MTRLVPLLCLILLMSSCLEETDDCTLGILTNNILHKHGKEWQIDTLIIKTSKSETIILSEGRVEVLKESDKLTLVTVYEIDDSAKHTIQFPSPCLPGNNRSPVKSSATSLIKGVLYEGTGYIGTELSNDSRRIRISQSPTWWADSTKFEVWSFNLKLRR